MWGTPLFHPRRRSYQRFIPTHVGNTRMPKPSLLSHPVHPHACGEHQIPLSPGTKCGGSSPRMWGTQPEHPSYQGLRRFIPTHVGNTVGPGLSCLFLPVHPHACGEHLQYDAGAPEAYGSSPRMWGTRGRRRSEARGSRFIPTHVGNTRPDPGPEPPDPVHPHACGEHSSARFWASAVSGSSPRMWGTPIYSP